MKNKGRLARRVIAVIVCMTLVIAALPQCYDRYLFVTELFAFFYDTVCKVTDGLVVKIDIG